MVLILWNGPLMSCIWSAAGADPARGGRGGSGCADLPRYVTMVLNINILKNIVSLPWVPPPFSEILDLPVCCLHFSLTCKSLSCDSPVFACYWGNRLVTEVLIMHEYRSDIYFIELYINLYCNTVNNHYDPWAIGLLNFDVGLLKWLQTKLWHHETGLYSSIGLRPGTMSTNRFHRFT